MPRGSRRAGRAAGARPAKPNSGNTPSDRPNRDNAASWRRAERREARRGNAARKRGSRSSFAAWRLPPAHRGRARRRGLPPCGRVAELCRRRSAPGCRRYRRRCARNGKRRARAPASCVGSTRIRPENFRRRAICRKASRRCRHRLAANRLPRSSSEVSVRAEPADRVGDRVAGGSCHIAELAHRFRRGEIHLLPRHANTVACDEGLSAGQPRN